MCSSTEINKKNKKPKHSLLVSLWFANKCANICVGFSFFRFSMALGPGAPKLIQGPGPGPGLGKPNTKKPRNHYHIYWDTIDLPAKCVLSFLLEGVSHFRVYVFCLREFSILVVHSAMSIGATQYISIVKTDFNSLGAPSALITSGACHDVLAIIRPTLALGFLA